MITRVAALCIAIAAFVHGNAAAECFMLDRMTVVDGDTLAIPGLQVTIGDKVLPLGTKGELRVRLEGVDAPETMKQFAGCPEEIALGMDAKRVLQDMTDGKPVELCTEGKTDRYRRLIGRLYVWTDGGRLNVQSALIERGLAKAWTGKKANWCAD